MPFVHRGGQVGHPHVLNVRVITACECRLGGIDVAPQRPSADPVVDFGLNERQRRSTDRRYAPRAPTTDYRKYRRYATLKSAHHQQVEQAYFAICMSHDGDNNNNNNKYVRLRGRPYIHTCRYYAWPVRTSESPAPWLHSAGDATDSSNFGLLGELLGDQSSPKW